MRTTPKAARTARFGATDARPPPSRIRDWRPSRAHECGIRRATDCIAAGMIWSGIMQPPRAPEREADEHAERARLVRVAGQARRPASPHRLRRVRTAMRSRPPRAGRPRRRRTADRGHEDDVGRLEHRDAVAPRASPAMIVAGGGRGGRHSPRHAELPRRDEPRGGGHRGQEHEQDELRGRPEGELREAAKAPGSPSWRDRYLTPGTVSVARRRRAAMGQLAVARQRTAPAAPS